MIRKNLTEKIAKAKATTIGSSGGNGYNSFTVVNSVTNGKRVMLSKTLLKSLGLESSFCVIPVPEDGQILLAKELDCENKYSLSKTDSRICYSSELVNYLAKTFNLDYATRTSISFSRITIDRSLGFPVAVIQISDPESFEEAVEEAAGETESVEDIELESEESDEEEFVFDDYDEEKQ